MLATPPRRPKHTGLFVASLLCFLVTITAGKTTAAKIIIAQNSGGNSLIANSLVGTTLAVAKGARYLELPVTMSADNQLLLFNDLTLNKRTNVAEFFPSRHREDGNYYMVDFLLDEIRQLSLQSVDSSSPVNLHVRIPTLQEELSLVEKLEQDLDTKIGLLVEIKFPWFYRDNGRDISGVVLDTLNHYLYDGTREIYLQCFDPEELQRIHDDLMVQHGVNFPLIQMIGDNSGNETKQKQADKWQPYNYDWLFTNTGLRIVKSYAAAIGIPLDTFGSTEQDSSFISYLQKSHGYDLQIFVYSSLSKEPGPITIDEITTVVTTKQGEKLIDGIYTYDFGKSLKYAQYLAVKEPTQEVQPYLTDIDQLNPESDPASDGVREVVQEQSDYDDDLN